MFDFLEVGRQRVVSQILPERPRFCTKKWLHAWQSFQKLLRNTWSTVNVCSPVALEEWLQALRLRCVYIMNSLCHPHNRHKCLLCSNKSRIHLTFLKAHAFTGCPRVSSRSPKNRSLAHDFRDFNVHASPAEPRSRRGSVTKQPGSVAPWVRKPDKVFPGDRELSASVFSDGNPLVV